MTCESYSEHLVDYVFGETGSARTADIESHLSSCAPCADEVRAIRETVRVLREADEIANQVRPDPQFASRVLRKMPQRRRDSVALIRRHSRSRLPLVAALSAAAVLLAVVVYVLAAHDSYYETKDDSERWTQAPGGKKSPGKPHPADSPHERPGQEPIRPPDTLPEPSNEADQEGGEFVEVEEPGIEPDGPVPAPSPDVKGEEPQDLGPIPVPGEPAPELATHPQEKPLKEWVARLYNVRGEFQLRRSGTDKWLRGSQTDKILKGDAIKTGSRGSGVVSLSAGGSVVFNRATVLSFKSHTEYEIEKGEVLACSHWRPLTLNCNGVSVEVKRASAYIQRRTRDTRVIAADGAVQVRCDGKTSVIAPGKGAIISADGKTEAIQKVNLEKEIEWVCEATRKFKLWIEGECCRHFGYFVVQQHSRDLSNFASVYKVGTSAYLSWRLRLPHAMPCYVWVRYSRNEREPEKVGLVVNCRKVEEKTIKAASAKWFWVRAFKVSLGRRNDMKLGFTSKKHVKSRVDLVLVTNDPDFKPARSIPKGGYYGKK